MPKMTKEEMMELLDPKSMWSKADNSVMHGDRIKYIATTVLPAIAKKLSYSVSKDLMFATDEENKDQTQALFDAEKLLKGTLKLVGTVCDTAEGKVRTTQPNLKDLIEIFKTALNQTPSANKPTDSEPTDF